MADRRTTFGAGSPARADPLRRFYEESYERDAGIASIPSDDDFVYGQMLRLVRPGLRPSARVLDLGCNNGNLSLYMARRVCRVTGVDLARNAIDAAVRSAKHYGIGNADFRCMDFLAEWDEPNAFDFVLCSHVVEHVPDDASFVRKIAWALKGGGGLVIMAPCDRSSIYRAHVLLKGRLPHDEDVGHLRRYSLRGLSALCQGAGLSVIRRGYLDGPLRDWFILHPRLRRFNRLWAGRYIRSVFNGLDYGLAQFLFPGAVAVHAKKTSSGGSEAASEHHR